MKIKIKQYREDKGIDRYELEIEAGVVVLQSHGHELVIPIIEIADIKIDKPFYELSKEQKKYQIDFVTDFVKK
jgi:hypothetical protein